MEDQSVITHSRVKEMEDPRGQGAHGKLEGKWVAAALRMLSPENNCTRICGSSSGVVLRTSSRTLGLVSLHRSNRRLKRLSVSPGGRTGDGAPGEPQASSEHAGPWYGKPGAGSRGGCYRRPREVGGEHSPRPTAPAAKVPGS